MKTLHTEVAIADFCAGLARGEYMVNTDYQRTDKVWPEAAKSFLIETILLEYPIPKLSLYQNLDLKSRTARKEIVDGQQRTRAIEEFFNNRHRLSKSLNEEFAGRTFDELEEDHQRIFLDYSLSFDLFAGASLEEVREVFRRMNSFTIPLNAEETRHATFQGPFKWFINTLARSYSESFFANSVFSEKQLNRMQDAKLLTELSHAMVNGITTTNKASLDKIYSNFDKQFAEEGHLREALEAALESALFSSGIRGTALAKPLNLYSLTLAYVQHQGIWEVPDSDYALPQVSSFEMNNPTYNLSVLAAALETASPNENPVDLRAFASAAKDKTNVAAQRQTRRAYYLAALSE